MYILSIMPDEHAKTEREFEEMIENLNIPDFLINPKILAAGIAVGIILRLLCLIIDRYGINEKWETVSSVIDIVGSIVFFAVFVLFTVYLIKK